MSNTYFIGNPEKYPHLIPPPGFRPIYRPGGPRPITGVAGDTFVLEEITALQGMKGWIRRMGLESGDWNVVGFQLQQGKSPIAELARIATPIGSPSTPLRCRMSYAFESRSIA